MSSEEQQPQQTPAPPATPNLEHLEREESRLWRLVLGFLLLLAAGLAAASWDMLRTLPQRLEAVPIGVAILVVLFAWYITERRREVRDLRNMVTMLATRAPGPPANEQLERLLNVITTSQQGYRELIDSFEDAVFTLTLDGRLRTMNRRVAEVLECEFSEVIGRPLDDFMEGISRAEAESVLPRFLERRNWSGLVGIRIRKSGRMRHFEVTLHAVVQEEKVVAISALAREVTEKRERETRFTGLFESLHEAVYIGSSDGTLLDVNRAMVRMLGYDTREELLAADVAALFADPAARTTLLADLENNGLVHDRDVVLHRKDGRQVYCLWNACAVWDAEGKVRYHGTINDVTQKRELTRKLHEEQEFRRRLIDCFPDAIVVMDSSARFTFVSSRMEELLGYPPEDFIGQPVGVHTHASEREALRDVCRKVLEGELPRAGGEWQVQHRDGSWKLLRSHASPLYDEQGNVAGLVSSLQDVTDLRRIEQQLIQNERLAAMGEMIDGFAHELNNPLTAILGASELLTSSTADESTARHCKLLNQQARRASEVVQNMLFFSRPPAPGSTRLSVPDLVNRSIQLHQHSLRANNITVDYLGGNDLPSVVGDPSQLMQVFLNLIINAEQAIREVRKSGSIRIRLLRNGKGLSCSFQDDGPGIAPELMPRIFEPFYTTKRPGRGTGMGLSICEAIVKEYGGHIEAQSAPGGGSVFIVWLPAAKVAETAIPTTTAARA